MKNVFAMVVALAMMSVTASAGIIDSFDSPAQFVISIPGLDTNNQVSPQSLGGWRDLQAFGSLANLTGTTGVFNGNLVFGNGPSGVGTLAVRWTSNNVGLGGGIGTNLLLGGMDSFSIDVVADDTIPTVLAYRVEDVFGNVATALANIGGSSAGSTFVVPFASFVGFADFSAAKFLQMTIAGGPNADITLDNLQTTGSPVPEPSSLALALTGLGIAGVVARRRKKQQVV